MSIAQGQAQNRARAAANAPRDFRSAFDAECRRSGRERASRQRAPHDRRRVVQRRHQYPDAVGLALYVAGLRPGDPEPEPCDPVRPLADGADRLSRAGLFRCDAVADALPDRDAVRWRPAGGDPFGARHPAAARGEAGPDAAAAARSRSGAHLHVGHGADRVPRHALDTGVSDRAVSVSPDDRLHGAARHRRDHCHDIGDRADLARRDQGGVGPERATAGAGGCDATQRGNRSGARHDRPADGALGAGQRALSAGKHPRDRRLRQSRLEREGAALHPAIGNAGHGRLSRRRRQGVGRHHDRVLDPDGARARAGRNRAWHLEATAPPPARALRGCATS